MLAQQSFTGNPLCRLSDIPARFRAAARPDNEVSLVVVAGREVVVRAPAAGGGAGGLHQDLQALLLRQDDPELRLGGDDMALEWVPGEWGWDGCSSPVAVQQQGVIEDRQQYSSPQSRSTPPPPTSTPNPLEEGAAPLTLPLYLLGQDVSSRWTFALDISAAREMFLAFLRDSCELEVAMKDVRVLLPGLSMDACAIAGQAVALSQWHQVGSTRWLGRRGVACGVWVPMIVVTSQRETENTHTTRPQPLTQPRPQPDPPLLPALRRPHCAI
jgi:hypothetical protein